MNENGSTNKKMVPPYVPWRTFVNFLDSMKGVGLPSHIDRSVMPSMSGGTRSWLLSSLRAMTLIDNDNAPTEFLRDLVNAEPDERPDKYRAIFDRTYGFLSNGSIDISQTTPEQINKALQEAGASGSTVQKSRAFFLLFGKNAGVQMSPHLKRASRESFPRKPGQRKVAKKRKTISPPLGHEGDSPPAPKSEFEVLYGMLDTDNMTEDEQQAVWLLMRYLKKR